MSDSLRAQAPAGIPVLRRRSPAPGDAAGRGSADSGVGRRRTAAVACAYSRKSPLLMAAACLPGRRWRHRFDTPPRPQQLQEVDHAETVDTPGAADHRRRRCLPRPGRRGVRRPHHLHAERHRQRPPGHEELLRRRLRRDGDRGYRHRELAGAGNPLQRSRGSDDHHPRRRLRIDHHPAQRRGQRRLAVAGIRARALRGRRLDVDERPQPSARRLRPRPTHRPGAAGHAQRAAGNRRRHVGGLARIRQGHRAELRGPGGGADGGSDAGRYRAAAAVARSGGHRHDGGERTDVVRLRRSARGLAARGRRELSSPGSRPARAARRCR